MSLPVTPDIRTVLKDSVANLREVIVPSLEGEWERFCGVLLVGSLEYALGLLDGDRGAVRRAELAAALQALRADVEDAPALKAAMEVESPFEAATRLLVWGQRNACPLAERIRAVLHPVLFAQIDTELAASAPLMQGFGVAMRGRRED